MNQTTPLAALHHQHPVQQRRVVFDGPNNIWGGANELGERSRVPVKFGERKYCKLSLPSIVCYSRLLQLKAVLWYCALQVGCQEEIEADRMTMYLKQQLLNMLSRKDVVV